MPTFGNNHDVFALSNVMHDPHVEFAGVAHQTCMRAISKRNNQELSPDMNIQPIARISLE